MQLNDASFSRLRVLAFFIVVLIVSQCLAKPCLKKKKGRKALKAYLDLYEDGGLFYWQLHVKIGCQGHLLGVDL